MRGGRGDEGEKGERGFPYHIYTRMYMCVCVRAPERTCVDVLPRGVSVYVCVDALLHVYVCIRGPSARFHRHRGWIGSAHAPTAENLPSQGKSATETRRGACRHAIYNVAYVNGHRDNFLK